MSTFNYLRAHQIRALGSENTRDFEKIIGLKAVDAERFLSPIKGGYSKTAAGYLRVPSDPWRAHSYVDKLFKVIVRVEWAKDADPGTVEVVYADGSTDLIDKYGLLCVEIPIER